MHVILTSRYHQGRWIHLMLDTLANMVYFNVSGLTMEDTRWYDKIKEDPAFQMLVLVLDATIPWW